MLVSFLRDFGFDFRIGRKLLNEHHKYSWKISQQCKKFDELGNESKGDNLSLDGSDSISTGNTSTRSNRKE